MMMNMLDCFAKLIGKPHSYLQVFPSLDGSNACPGDKLSLNVAVRDDFGKPKDRPLHARPGSLAVGQDVVSRISPGNPYS